MKHAALKFFGTGAVWNTMLIIRMSMVVMLAFMASITAIPALAASNGILYSDGNIPLQTPRQWRS